VDHLKAAGKLGSGVAVHLANACLALEVGPQEVAERVAAGRLDFSSLPWLGLEACESKALELAEVGLARIAERRRERDALLEDMPVKETPWLYVIVATGDIREDIVQARMAAAQGADVIAVIRSTGQSLLDYVPFGATTEGYGGTYATQENFRLMRAALDEESRKLGRYVRLVNYCSGLCMPEIAAMGALERLDVMLNDAMYGILFRDINAERTLRDQRFSRMIKRVCRHHHKHRRGQLPDHGGCLQRRTIGCGVPVHQLPLRQAFGPARQLHRARARVSDRSQHRG
jgi:beta-lysine 5,6-aminomutase alpha subunit